MKQDDGTGMNASGQLFESLLVGRLLILVPVYIGKTPEKSLIAEIFCHLQVLRAVFSLRRPVKFHHFLAGGLLVKSGNTVQLFRRRLPAWKFWTYPGATRCGFRRYGLLPPCV